MFPQPGNEQHRVALVVALNRLLNDHLLPAASKAVDGRYAVQLDAAWRGVTRDGREHLTLFIKYAMGEFEGWVQSEPFEILRDEAEFDRLFESIIWSTTEKVMEKIRGLLDWLDAAA
jgi:hypothetical protein